MVALVTMSLSPSLLTCSQRSLAQPQCKLYGDILLHQHSCFCRDWSQHPLILLTTKVLFNPHQQCCNKGLDSKGSSASSLLGACGILLRSLRRVQCCPISLTLKCAPPLTLCHDRVVLCASLPIGIGTCGQFPYWHVHHMVVNYSTLLIVTSQQI